MFIQALLIYFFDISYFLGKLVKHVWVKFIHR